MMIRDEFHYELGQGYLYDSHLLDSNNRSQDLDAPIELLPDTQNTEDMQPQ